MSSNARWRRLKIVVTDISEEDEIIGGLKNALDRGSTIEQAKQSFVKAGYKAEQVESAMQKVPSIISRVSKPLSSKQLKETNSKKSKERDPVVELAAAENPVPITKEKKQAGSGLKIALIIMLILVIGMGAALYFFRDQIF